jgi:hypothetical protein
VFSADIKIVVFKIEKREKIQNKVASMNEKPANLEAPFAENLEIITIASTSSSTIATNTSSSAILLQEQRPPAKEITSSRAMTGTERGVFLSNFLCPVYFSSGNHV